jgi:mono/diheme cytochrome c family protein
MRLCTGLLWIGLLVPGVLLAEPLAPPFDLKDPAEVSQGRDVFNRRCAGRCHGRDGQEGFDGPILVGKDYLAWPVVYATLVTGRPTTAMPNWSDRLTPDELWHIIAFVASLGDQAKAASSR